MLLKSKLLGVTRSFLVLGLSTVRELSKKRIFSSRKLAETLGKAWGKIEKSDGNFNIFHLQRQFFACATRFWASESRAKVRDRNISTRATNGTRQFFEKLFQKFCGSIFSQNRWFFDDFQIFFNFPHAFRNFSREKWGRAIWKMGAALR